MTRPSTAHLPVLIALRSLDLVSPEDVVAWAADRVASGESSPTMVDLSILTEPSAVDVDALLARLGNEFGTEEMTESRVGALAAAHVARSMAQGDLEPIDAARQIWRIALLAPDAEPLLREFIGLASEWEDDPNNRLFYEAQIRACALALAGDDDS